MLKSLLKALVMVAVAVFSGGLLFWSVIWAFSMLPWPKIFGAP